MTATVATLSLEPFTLHSRRRQSASSTSGVLREYVLGPENSLVRQGIGLEETAAGEMRLQFPIVPLFLHAPSGFGKSQLLHALAAVWSRQNGPDRALLVSAADFARSAAHAQKLDDVPVFQQKYQRIDLLLIDDLDQLQRKPSAQQQLCSILDRREQHHRPTVLTAREPLQSLGLIARLSSRLAGGLDIPLHLPSWQTRREILEKVCRQRGIELTAEAEQLLSEHPALTIPQLVGLLNGLLTQSISTPSAHSRLEEANAAYLRRLTTDSPSHTPNAPHSLPESHDAARFDVADFSEQLNSNRPAMVDPKRIIRATAHYFGLKLRNLTGTSRRKLDVLARSLAMYLIRELSGESFQQIGQHFGNRDHSTVMHAYRKMEQQRVDDSATRQAILEIRKRVECA